MNELAAKKKVAILLFNGLKSKMEGLETTLNCRHYKVGSNNEYSIVQFMGDKIFLNIGSVTIAKITSDECKLFDKFSEEVDAELAIQVLLTLSVSFSGTLSFNMTVERKLLTAVINDANLYWRVNAVANVLINGFVHQKYCLKPLINKK